MARHRLPTIVADALRGGAVSGIALRLRRGFSLSGILTWLGERFGLTKPAEVQPVMDIGTQAVDAIDQLAAIAPDGHLPTEAVPLNPVIPRTILEGGRFVYELEIDWEDTYTGLEGTRRLRIPSERDLTWGEIEQLAQSLLSQQWTDSPKDGQGPQVIVTAVRGLDAQRGW